MARTRANTGAAATAAAARPAKRASKAAPAPQDEASKRSKPASGGKRSDAAAAPPDSGAAASAGDNGEDQGRNKDHSDFYLMKNEPDDFGVDDLEKEPEQTTCWEGVRNFRARNILRAMEPGQRCFFYHSNCKTPGIAGIMEVAKAAYPDDTQFDPKAKYYDSKSKKDDPRWSMVDVKLVRKLKRLITLEELKALRGTEERLASMQLFTTARLSIQNVTREQWDCILEIEGKEAAN